jgi:hypothetical protein
MRCRCMTTRWVVEEQVNHFEFDTRNITAYRDVPLGYKNEPTTMNSTRGLELPMGCTTRVQERANHYALDTWNRTAYRGDCDNWNGIYSHVY